MVEPSVSIVLPTYKRAEKLAATIESVLKQTYKDWELIVVDDNDYASAHSRKTRDLVRTYQNSHNIVFTSHGANRGACAARNTGIALAKGKYVAFLDDDDAWSSNKLELQLDMLRKNPGVGLVFCDLICIDNTDNTKKWIKYRFDKEDLFRDLLKNGAGICTSALVVKKELLVSVGGFDDKLPSYQDYDLLLRLSMCSSYKSIDAPLLSYNVFSDGISRNYQSKFTGKKIVLEKYGKYFADKGLARYYGMHLGVLGDYAILSGKRWTAVKYYLLSISKRPISFTVYIKLVITLLGGESLYRFVSDRYQKLRRFVQR